VRASGASAAPRLRRGTGSPRDGPARTPASDHDDVDVVLYAHQISAVARVERQAVDVGGDQQVGDLRSVRASCRGNNCESPCRLRDRRSVRRDGEGQRTAIRSASGWPRPEEVASARRGPQPAASSFPALPQRPTVPLVSPDDRPTLAAFVDWWLPRRRVRGRPLAPNTVAYYRVLLRLHIMPTFGQTAVADLKRADVRAWHDALQDDRGPQIAAKSYRLLRTLLISAVEEELMPASPCTLRGAAEEWSPERPVLTVEQVLALSEEVAPQYRAVILLGAFCCLRIGELAALRRDALDLDKPTVSVVATAGHVNGYGWVVGPVKSAAGRRVVTIPAAILPDVRAHLDTYAEEGPDGRVFRGPRGGGLRSSTFMARDFTPACQRLGLSGLHFHDLRHTGNTLAAATGASLADLMARIGHASMDAALRYQHATRTQDVAVAGALSEMITRSPSA
jgi:integrase